MGATDGEFGRLFERAGGLLFGYAFLLTGDRGEAEDLVQEAFLRAWRDWKRVSSLESPDTWLRRVVHNLAIGRWRRLAVRRARSPILAVTTSPALSAEHLDVVRALNRLPPRQREALVLVAFTQLTPAEVAEQMRVAEGTVRVWLSRARASVAETLRIESAPLLREGEANGTR
jgi:RNA polymerase sigma-70 factor (ECF subfamily)